MKLLFLLLLFFAAAAGWGKDLILKNSQSGTFRFDAPDGKNRFLFFLARIKLPPPCEEWGFHALELKLNGQELALPVNKPEKLVNPQTFANPAYAVRDTAGRLFVKADSDWTAFNAPRGGVYSSTWTMNSVNQIELNNVFYSFAIPLKDLKPKDNVLTLKAVLPSYMDAYPVEIAGLEAAGFGDQVIFRRDFLQAVYPWSFPSLAEIRQNPELVVAKGETGGAAFSVYCFAPSEMKLPDDLQLYRLDNTIIPAKLKKMAESHIPNIGKLYVPELLTPLKKGSVLKLPQGTTTLYLKYRGEKAGTTALAGVPVKVRTLDLTLPDPESLPVENGLYVMAGHTDKQKIHPEFRAYGITQIMLSPWGAPIKLSIKDDKLQADFRKFDQRLKFYQSFGLNRRKLLFGTSEPILSQIAKLTKQDVDGEEFQRRFKEFIELFFNHADELKLEVYLSLYDEANFQKKVWTKTQTLTKIAVTVPNSRMWSTVTELASAAFYFDTLGYRKGRDLTVTHPFMTIGRPDSAVNKGVMAPSKTMGELRGRFHGEYDGITSYPGIGNRLCYGMRSRHSELKFFMGFAFWWGDMGKPNVKPTNWYYVSYPFFEPETGVRYTAIGWEAIRTGIDDYRYLELAARCLARKYGKDEAEKRLKKLIALEEHTVRGFLPADYFGQIRNQLIKIISEAK